jgi:hypothetical protein
MSRPVFPNVRAKLYSASEYATPNDVQRLFASEMADLFHLAFLLTADGDKAEQCMIRTMRECMSSRFVLKSWLPVWARNAVVRNGIQIVTGCAAGPSMLSAVRRPQPSTSAADNSAGILELRDFDRLVYVMYFIERYPIGDCATFLGRSRREVWDAQNRAAGQVMAFEQEWRCTPGFDGPYEGLLA